MSKPFRGDPDAPINSAMCEIISGISSLNMYPDPIPENERKNGIGFLTDTDANVRHSIDHFRAAIDRLRSLQEPNNTITNFLLRAEKAGIIDEETFVRLSDFIKA